jgi:hypothetical protein
MDLSEYQRLSRRTAEYPREAWLAYPTLGLAGEVAEHAKKAIRDDGGSVSEERKVVMSKSSATCSGMSPRSPPSWGST